MQLEWQNLPKHPGGEISPLPWKKRSKWRRLSQLWIFLFFSRFPKSGLRWRRITYKTPFWQRRRSSKMQILELFIPLAGHFFHFPPIARPLFMQSRLYWYYHDVLPFSLPRLSNYFLTSFHVQLNHCCFLEIRSLGFVLELAPSVQLIFFQKRLAFVLAVSFQTELVDFIISSTFFSGTWRFGKTLVTV